MFSFVKAGQDTVPQTKEQKQKNIEDLRERIEKQKAMIFVDFTGLKVKDFSNLRKKVKKTNGEIKVAKKSLLGLAFQKSGIKIEFDKFKGEIAVVFGFQDQISSAKTIYQFTQGNPNLKILGGFFDNQIVGVQDVIELAKLPSKEELLAKLFFLPNFAIFNNLQVNFSTLLKVKN